MNKTGRLIIAIASVFIILILMGFGIYATFADISIGGDIAVNGHDLQMTVTGKMYGHDLKHLTEDQAFELDGNTWDSTTNPDGIENSIDWSDLDLRFVHKEVDIVIKISFTNNHTDKNVVVAYQDLSPATNKNFTITITTDAQDNIVPVGETATYTITLKLTDKGKEASGKMNVIFTLMNQQ